MFKCLVSLSFIVCFSTSCRLTSSADESEIFANSRSGSAGGHVSPELQDHRSFLTGASNRGEPANSTNCAPAQGCELVSFVVNLSHLERGEIKYGHAAMAVGNRLYDFGWQYSQPFKDSDPVSVGGGRWWKTNSLRDFESRHRSFAKGGGPIIKIPVCVKSSVAGAVMGRWNSIISGARYDRPTGLRDSRQQREGNQLVQHCSSAVVAAYEGRGGWLLSPDKLARKRAKMRHQCGSLNRKKVKSTILAW